MGVPELLKYVARNAPSALSKVPHRKDKGETPDVSFDYVLIDATNVLQTIGVEVLYRLLVDDEHTSAAIRVSKAVLLLCDGQRQRIGSARAGRSHSAQHHGDYALQKFITTFMRSEEERMIASATGEGNGDSENPAGIASSEKETRKRGRVEGDKAGASASLYFSGREHPGEGDFKMLSIQRRLVFEAAVRDQPIPTFLFVSEDADLLCGALCGPYPSHVSIATQLREMNAETCILRMSHVLAFIGQSTGITRSGEENEVGGKNMKKGKKNTKPVVEEVKPAEAEHPELAGKSTGTRKTFDDEEAEEPKQVSSAVASSPGPKKSGPLYSDYVSVASQPNDPTWNAARQLHHAALDFIFLFTMILGNDIVKPAVQGATKIDAASIWQSYCQLNQKSNRFTSLFEFESFELEAPDPDDPTSVATSEGRTFALNCHFLAQVLESLHYADPSARPPVTEERRVARQYLKNLAATVMQYAAGALTDTRERQIELATQMQAPSLASLFHVLTNRAWRLAEYTASFEDSTNNGAIGFGQSGNRGLAVTLPQKYFVVSEDFTVAKPQMTTQISMSAASRYSSALGPLGSNPNGLGPHSIRIAVSDAKPIKGARVAGLKHTFRSAEVLPGAQALTASIVQFATLAAKPPALTTSQMAFVPLTTLERAWCMSLIPEVPQLKQLAQHQFRKMGTATGHATHARFAFDARRMLPTASSTTDASIVKHNAATVLSAAGLSMSYYTPRVIPAGGSLPPKKPQRNDAKKAKEQKRSAAAGQEKKANAPEVKSKADAENPKQPITKKVGEGAEGQSPSQVAAVSAESTKKSRSQRKKEKITAKKSLSSTKATTSKALDAKKAKKKRPGKQQRMQFAKSAQ